MHGLLRRPPHEIAHHAVAFDGSFNGADQLVNPRRASGLFPLAADDPACRAHDVRGAQQSVAAVQYPGLRAVDDDADRRCGTYGVHDIDVSVLPRGHRRGSSLQRMTAGYRISQVPPSITGPAGYSYYSRAVDARRVVKYRRLAGETAAGATPPAAQGTQ